MLTPKNININNPIRYNKQDKKDLKVLQNGRISVDYSGTDLDTDRSERIGYIDVFDADYLETIPPHLKVTINVF